MESFVSRFHESPARFHNENRVEDELKTLLRTAYPGTVDIAGGYLQDSINDNREAYASQLCQRGELSEVQSQLNIGLSSEFWKHLEDPESTPLLTDFTDGQKRSNVLLDVGILTEATHPMSEYTTGYEPEDDVLEFCTAGGAQFWPPTAITHAIEIKYFKTMTAPGTDLESEKPSWERVDDDIKELKWLAAHGNNGHGAESHLIVVSNMNIFRRDEDAPDDDFTSRLEGLREMCGDDIHLWYVHPQVD